MNRIFQTSALLLAMVLLAATALAGDENFSMPKDMSRLLPAQADGVLGIASMEKLDALWRDILPEGMDEEEASLLPFFAEALLGFEDMIDPGKPLLITTRILSAMDTQGILFTLILPIKNEDQDFSQVEGFEEFLIIREGDYIGVSTDPDWQPTSETPLWAKELRDGVLTASLDLESVVETYRPLIEMGLGAMESQAQNGTGMGEINSVEETMATVKMLRALLESVAGLEIVLDEDGNSIRKELLFSTKPGSPLAPGPQPSFDEALNLTRFLPGGENLLVVSALDQSAQMELWAESYLATVHSEMETLDSETGERYAQWSTEYLNTMEINFLPAAMTLRVEKDNSSFQHLLRSNNVQEDWKQLVHLADGLHDLGNGVDLAKIDTQDVDGHEVLGWAVTWQEDEIQNMVDSNVGAAQENPMMASNLMGLLRFAPGNIYMAHIDNYILVCGGPNADLIQQLVRNVAKGKGQVDPRVKKALKNAGSGMQMATVGDLNALVQVIMEIAEEFGDEFTWPIDHPLPFLQSVEINGADYLIHLEMEKSALREVIQVILEED